MWALLLGFYENMTLQFNSMKILNSASLKCISSGTNLEQDEDLFAF